MTETMTIPKTVTDSISLQKIIEDNGDNPATFIFPSHGNILIKSLIRFYNNAEIAGNTSTWTLMKDAPVSPFGPQVPLVAPHSEKAAKNICIHDVIFEGNRDNQNRVPKKNGKNWGLGYHNFIGLGTNKSIAFSNAVNCSFYNLEFNNSLGDGLRPEGATNIITHDIKGKRTGHDTINYSAVKGGEVYNVNLMLGVGSGVRMRSCQDIKIHDCKLDNSMGLTYGPGIQIQSTATNWTSSNIEIYNNTMLDTYGPGIQVAGSVPNNGLVNIHDNLFLRCGAMPESVNRPILGGVAFIGFPVKICNNTIVDSYGFGLVAGAYDVGSNYSYDATIERNIITGTRKAKKVGTASGTGIANLVGSRYDITCSENCLSGNLAATYNVTNINGITKDPLFIGSGDYHLQDASPCRFEDYQLGCYSDSQKPEDPVTEDPAKVIISCTDAEADELIKSLSHEYTIYRKV